MNTDTNTDSCFICGDDNQNALQTHHIVPRRHGGSDDEENLVQLCANCHQAIERLYDKRFYRKLGVADRDKAPGQLLDDLLEKCDSRTEIAIKAYESNFEEFPEHEDGSLVVENVKADLGYGELAGYALGYHDSLQEIENEILGPEEEEDSE